MIFEKKKLILSIFLILYLFSQTGYSNGALIEKEAQAIIDRVLADMGLGSKSLIEGLNSRAVQAGLEATRIAPEIEKVWKARSSAAFGRYIEEVAEHGTVMSSDVFSLVEKKLHSPETLQKFADSYPTIFEGLKPEVQGIIAIVTDAAKKVEGREVLWTWNQGALRDLEQLLMADRQVTNIVSEVKEGGASPKQLSSMPEFLKPESMKAIIAQNVAIAADQKKALLEPLFPDFLIPMETFRTNPEHFFALLVAHGKFGFLGAQKAEQGVFYRFLSNTTVQGGGIELRFISTSYNSGIDTLIKIELSHQMGAVSFQHTFLYMDNSLIKWILTEDGRIIRDLLF